MRLPKVPPLLVTILRYALIAAAIGFAVFAVASQWTGVRHTLQSIAPLSLVVSLLLVIFGLAAGVMSWVTLLNGIGRPVPLPSGAQMMLVGQLGKYIPGSVWAYLMQMELGRQLGVARPRVLVASLYAAGIGVVSSLVMGSLALSVLAGDNSSVLWLYVLLPIGLVFLHPRIMTAIASLVLKIFRRPPLDHRIGYGTVVKAVVWSLLSYAFYGFHLWILVNSLVDPDLPNLLLLTGAISLGFTVGLFAFILPSGIGVREAVLIAAMSLLLTLPQATAISLISRLEFAVGDISAAGIAVLVLVIARRVRGAAEIRVSDVDSAGSIDGR